MHTLNNFKKGLAVRLIPFSTLAMVGCNSLSSALGMQSNHTGNVQKQYSIASTSSAQRAYAWKKEQSRICENTLNTIRERLYSLGDITSKLVIETFNIKLDITSMCDFSLGLFGIKVDDWLELRVITLLEDTLRAINRLLHFNKKIIYDTDNQIIFHTQDDLVRCYKVIRTINALNKILKSFTNKLKDFFNEDACKIFIERFSRCQESNSEVERVFNSVYDLNKKLLDFIDTCQKEMDVSQHNLCTMIPNLPAMEQIHDNAILSELVNKYNKKFAEFFFECLSGVSGSKVGLTKLNLKPIKANHGRNVSNNNHTNLMQIFTSARSSMDVNAKAVGSISLASAHTQALYNVLLKMLNNNLIQAVPSTSSSMNVHSNALGYIPFASNPALSNLLLNKINNNNNNLIQAIPSTSNGMDTHSNAVGYIPFADNPLLYHQPAQCTISNNNIMDPSLITSDDMDADINVVD